MQRMLQCGEPPTAVFCANDIQAIGAISQCREAGLRTGRNVGHRLRRPADRQFVEPQLTTVRVPAGEMGRLAAEAVLQHLIGRERLESVLLGTELVIRASAGRALRNRGCVHC